MMNRKTDYTLLTAQAQALIDGVPYTIANLSNISALIWQEMTELNWAGFYLLHDGKLVLGPFQGKPACVEIAVGKGVCGTAAENGLTQLVPDVHQFPGHIACDSASNSEIVVPLFKDGKIAGVLDIDSPLFSRFTVEDKIGLEGLAKIIEKVL